MSDTPRTDAVKIACGFQAVPEPMLQHAYELERENAALRDALQSIWYRMPSDEFIEDHDAAAVSTFKQIKKILNAVQKEAQP